MQPGAPANAHAWVSVDHLKGIRLVILAGQAEQDTLGP
jgi:hypothetical protein